MLIPELNDPIDQRERFKHREELSAAVMKKQTIQTKTSLNALEIGMPPTGGIGFGIDRMRTLASLILQRSETYFLFPNHEDTGRCKERSKQCSIQAAEAGDSQTVGDNNGILTPK